MSAMAKTLGGFRAALLIGWALLGVVGMLYARSKGIPSWAALPVLAAFLVEYPFYLVPAFPERAGSAGRRPAAGFLVASAVLPYLVCCLGAIQFELLSWLKLIALALCSGPLVSRFSRAIRLVDIGFLALVVAVKVGRYFEPASIPLSLQGRRIGILGDLALFNISVLVLMLERRVPETGYGFLPSRAGLAHRRSRNYLYFLPVGFPWSSCCKATHFGCHPRPAGNRRLLSWASCWCSRSAEEFFFRGVLQQWIEDWTGNRRAALLITGLLFGLVHLWFRAISQLEMGDCGRRSGLVLRPGPQPGGQHPGRDGDARPGGCHLARVLSVSGTILFLWQNLDF